MACLMVIVAVAIRRDNKLWGIDLSGKAQQEVKADTVATQTILEDGTIVINTTQIGKDVQGYAGNVPLEVSVKDGKIVSVKALKNNETPDFFAQASALLGKWNGKTLQEASEMQVDAVSGATFSSRAIINNVRLGAQYAMNNPVSAAPSFDWSVKNVGVLLFALIAAILPLFVRNKTYHNLQLIYNVLVLGLWGGTFISYSLLVGWLSNGVNLMSSLALVVLAVTAFVYPLFGKRQYYCTHVCPYGSLQQLVGKVNEAHKRKLSPRVVKALSVFRRSLWAVLMFLMICGVLFEWMDYEPFSAFIFESASWVVIAIAVAFIILSAFVTRPYCRFVCPTGTLLKFSEGMK